MANKFTPSPANEFVLSTSASASAVSVPAMPELSFEAWLSMSMKEYPVTLDLPSDLLPWIGKIVSYWALAEWIQAGTIAKLLNIGRKEGRVMFGARIGNSLSKIKQLMEIKEIPLPADLSDASMLLSRCDEARNLLGHGVWMLDPESGDMCVQNASGQWKQAQPPVSKRKYPEAFFPTNPWFEETLEEVKSAIRWLQALDGHIDTALATSPEKSG